MTIFGGNLSFYGTYTSTEYKQPMLLIRWQELNAKFYSITAALGVEP